MQKIRSNIYIRHYSLFVLLTVMLIGCERPGDLADVRNFMQKAQFIGKATNVKIATLEYSPPRYESDNLRSPFVLPDANINGASFSSLSTPPDSARPKQALEKFSIEKLEFKGIIVNRKANKIVGLVVSPDGVYSVKIGDYLGKNYGQIIEIQSEFIEIVEKKKNGRGQWLAIRRKLL